MTALPDVESLRLLVLVGERGSLTSAAAELGISQPAASKRMNSLERRLGVLLLDRTRRGSSLTASGQLVCGWAARVLQELGVLLDGVEVLRGQHAAQLTVAASLTIAEHLLPLWLGQLRRSDPDVRVGLQVMNSTRVCEAVRAEAVVLGFIESPHTPAGLHSRVVANDRLVLVVAPEHPWARRRRPVGAAELARTPIISREQGSGTRDTAERAVARCGEQLIDPLLELGSSAAVRSAALGGVGPALLSELVVSGDIAAHALVEVATEGIDLGRSLRAVWHVGRRPAGAAATLIANALRARGRSG
ncbi:LysR family transcriptional regulator [Pseudonocardia sp. GCM10023141]|uniref:LysR family transcriptional regulator n=1 Tax=Pseudonocardia sp. GCM10023141 TaxID=3252653 RepID=UPI00360AA997